jgi:hypothetical protein
VNGTRRAQQLGHLLYGLARQARSRLLHLAEFQGLRRLPTVSGPTMVGRSGSTSLEIYGMPVVGSCGCISIHRGRARQRIARPCRSSDGARARRGQVAAPVRKLDSCDTPATKRSSGISTDKGNHDNDCDCESGNEPDVPLALCSLSGVGIGTRVCGLRDTAGDDIRNVIPRPRELHVQGAP